PSPHPGGALLPGNPRRVGGEEPQGAAPVPVGDRPRVGWPGGDRAPRGLLNHPRRSGRTQPVEHRKAVRPTSRRSSPAPTTASDASRSGGPLVGGGDPADAARTLTNPTHTVRIEAEHAHPRRPAVVPAAPAHRRVLAPSRGRRHRSDPSP